MADDALCGGDPLVKGMSMVYIHRQQVTNLRSITVGDHHLPIHFCKSMTSLITFAKTAADDSPWSVGDCRAFPPKA